MQREREAMDVGALTNMAAGESVVTRNLSVPVALSRVTVMKYNRTSIWHRMMLMSAIKRP